VLNTYRDDYTKTFKLKSTQFDVDGKILNINIGNEPMYIETNFELTTSTHYNLTSNDGLVAEVYLTLINTDDNKSRTYEIDTYMNNLLDNIEDDFKNFIDNMYISDTTETELTTKGVIGSLTKEEVLFNKKAYLYNTLEEIKTSGVFKNTIIKYIIDYVQHFDLNNDIGYHYNNTTTGLDI